MVGFITILCHRFKQPIILGYILAGILIGPYTPPFSFISDELTIKTLAELGVIFLMFSLGLEFNLHKFSRVGVAVFIAALAELSVREGMGSALSLNVRKIISELIPILSLVVSMGFVFAFSAGILPPMHLMIMILILAAVLAVFLFPWWVKLHARLQISLMETLKENENKGQ